MFGFGRKNNTSRYNRWSITGKVTFWQQAHGDWVSVTLEESNGQEHSLYISARGFRSNYRRFAAWLGLDTDSPHTGNITVDVERHDDIDEIVGWS